MIKQFKTFENMINADYLIGLPSGQIIDIHYTDINNLKQEGLIVYNKGLNSYVFKDELYNNILGYLNRNSDNLPKPSIKEEFVDRVADFFDKQRNVRSYIILVGGLIDVNGDIFISGGRVKKIPFLFKRVSGDFIMRDCGLENLMGAPEEVGGSFIVCYNNILTLRNGPKYVGGIYDCSENCLISLNGAPETIKGDFNCSGNFLPDLTGAPKTVGDYFDCSDNPLQNIENKPDCKHFISDYKGVKKKTFKDEGDGKLSW